MNKAFDLWLGLLGLGLVLFFVFSDPTKTQKIVTGLSDVNVGFINTLQGRTTGSGQVAA